MIAFDENDYLDMECEEYLGEKEIKDFLEKDKKRFKRRKTDFKKATRKRKIVREVYHSLDPTWEWYDNLHQYSKNKIHCSCPMCSTKTRNKGKRRHNKPYAPSINYSMMDKRRQMAMDEDEKEFFN
jgi:hypothetical protein